MYPAAGVITLQKQRHFLARQTHVGFATGTVAKSEKPAGVYKEEKTTFAHNRSTVIQIDLLSIRENGKMFSVTYLRKIHYFCRLNVRIFITVKSNVWKCVSEIRVSAVSSVVRSDGPGKFVQSVERDVKKDNVMGIDSPAIPRFIFEFVVNAVFVLDENSSRAQHARRTELQSVLLARSETDTRSGRVEGGRRSEDSGAKTASDPAGNCPEADPAVSTTETSPEETGGSIKS